MLFRKNTENKSKRKLFPILTKFEFDKIFPIHKPF